MNTFNTVPVRVPLAARVIFIALSAIAVLGAQLPLAALAARVMG